MYQCLQVLPKLWEALTKASESHKSPLLGAIFATPIKDLEADFSKFLDMVETTLDFEAIEQGD
ncbi:hypothetical protein MRX96_056446, partial [Rhipicephalus microplus]